MRVRKRGFTVLIVAATLGAFPAVAAADSRDDLPREAAAAEAYYESNPDLWATGPAQLILLDEERELLESLATTAERAAFIEWFWDRRDPELRDDVNPVRAEFYARVATANRKYRDFPRGWRSDRGMVHVILGQPDAVRHSFGFNGDAKVWTYYTVGPDATEAAFGSLGGEIAVAFVKPDNRAGYQIYGGFGGPGVLPLYVRDALRFARLATVVDPFLEPTFGN